MTQTVTRITIINARLKRIVQAHDVRTCEKTDCVRCLSFYRLLQALRDLGAANVVGWS